MKTLIVAYLALAIVIAEEDPNNSETQKDKRSCLSVGCQGQQNCPYSNCGGIQAPMPNLFNAQPLNLQPQPMQFNQQPLILPNPRPQVVSLPQSRPPQPQPLNIQLAHPINLPSPITLPQQQIQMPQMPLTFNQPISQPMQFPSQQTFNFPQNSQQRCCQVVHPPQCQPQRGCTIRRHYECSNLCNSMATHLVPKPTASPQCHYIKQYPYAYCGNYEAKNCGSCYSCGGMGYNPQVCSSQSSCDPSCRNTLFDNFNQPLPSMNTNGFNQGFDWNQLPTQTDHLQPQDSSNSQLVQQLLKLLQNTDQNPGGSNQQPQNIFIITDTTNSGDVVAPVTQPPSDSEEE